MEFGNVLFKICERTDKQADRHTYMQTLITILCTPSEVNMAKRTKLAKTGLIAVTLHTPDRVTRLEFYLLNS